MLSFGEHPIPFVEHLGFTLHKFENGESELRYTAKPEHLNTFEVTHGGASMTLLDVTMAVAARSLESDEDQLYAGCTWPFGRERFCAAPHQEHGVLRGQGL